MEKKWIPLSVLAGTTVLAFVCLTAFIPNKTHHVLRPIPKGCVFRTVMGEESSDSIFIFKTPERVTHAVNRRRPGQNPCLAYSDITEKCTQFSCPTWTVR